MEGCSTGDGTVGGRTKPASGVLQRELGNKHLKAFLFRLPPPTGASHWPNPRGKHSRKKLANSFSTAQPLGAHNGGRGVES